MEETVSLISKSNADTAKIAGEIARISQPGDIILLDGSLGAGKTHFVKYVAAELGSIDSVTSPTFTIANFYETQTGRLLHMDAYRLSGITEFRELGLADFFEEAIVLIEWGSIVMAEFEDFLAIKISHLETGSDTRLLEISAIGNRWKPEPAKLAARLSALKA